MTTEEAAEILRMFSAAYPQVKISELTTRIWYESALQKTDFLLAKRIAIDLIAHQSPQFPTPAVFNGLKTQLTKREEQKYEPVEPGAFPQNPKSKAIFDDLREAIGRPRKNTERTGKPEIEKMSQ